MEYRMAEPGDLDALVGLLRQLTELEEDFRFDEAAHRKGLELLIDRQPECCVMTAVDDGKVVGMASGQFVISTACGAPSLWVEDVVIDKTRRGQGVGTVLLEKLAAWAMAKGGRRMQLLADKDNTPAVGFYAKKGWRTTNFIAMRKMLGG